MPNIMISCLSYSIIIMLPVVPDVTSKDHTGLSVIPNAARYSAPIAKGIVHLSLVKCLVIAGEISLKGGSLHAE